MNVTFILNVDSLSNETAIKNYGDQFIGNISRKIIKDAAEDLILTNKNVVPEAIITETKEEFFVSTLSTTTPFLFPNFPRIFFHSDAASVGWTSLMVEDWSPLRKFCEVSQRRHDEIKFYIRYYDPKISSFKPVSITDTKGVK